ncbi:MAG TPA: hypothetical protein VIH86_13535 [Puia sp.]|jgi:hypothetical protein
MKIAILFAVFVLFLFSCKKNKSSSKNNSTSQDSNYSINSTKYYGTVSAFNFPLEVEVNDNAGNYVMVLFFDSVITTGSYAVRTDSNYVAIRDPLKECVVQAVVKTSNFYGSLASVGDTVNVILSGDSLQVSFTNISLFNLSNNQIFVSGNFSTKY